MSKIAAWLAPDNTTDSLAEPIPQKSGYDLMLVRIGFTKNILKADSEFTFSQLRLLCKEKDDSE